MDRYDLQFRNMTKTSREYGLMVSGDEYFESFPLTKKEIKKILKRKKKELKRNK